MAAAAEPNLPADGEPETGASVTTACGGQILFLPNTPQAVFRGRRIFFCLSCCKDVFDQDPKSSCLVGSPLLDEEG